MAIESIEVIYEDGVFKPVEQLKLKPNTRGRVMVISDEDQDRDAAVEAQKVALQTVVGLGGSGRHDIARRHDEFLYGPD